MQQYHPVSDEKFREEVMALGDLLTEADHFNYFFTDRDGTLKSYSCSYPASVQPAYSGVIQVAILIQIMYTDTVYRPNLLAAVPKHARLLPLRQ